MPNFERPAEDDESKKSEKNRLFEIRKVIRGMDISINLDKDGEPISGTVDLQRKKLEANITPEGVRKGVEALGAFLTRHGYRDRFAEWVREEHEKLDRKIEERHQREDAETIRNYAKQEGVTEKEVVEEFLNEIERESSQE